MTTFTGRTFDGELVTIERVYKADGQYRADFRMTMADGKEIANFATLGSTHKTTMSQKLCESIGAMPYQDNHEDKVPFEAILQQWGSGNSYIINALRIDDDPVKVYEAIDLLKLADGSTTLYMMHNKHWHRISYIGKKRRDSNTLIELKLIDERKEKAEFSSIPYSTYANNWVVIRETAKESEVAA